MEPVCQGCRERDARIAQLERLVSQLTRRCQELESRCQYLETRCRELEEKLGRNASNSSLPPSANPPGAPKPVVKKATGRQPGGQPGHPAHLRQRLPADRLTQPTGHYLPAICECCQEDLPARPGPDDPEPRWHQVVELPPVQVEVTEHLAHGRECASCGHVTWAEFPDAVQAHVFGPRLAATITYMSSVLHASKRGIEEFVETVFGTPIALGSVSNLEREMSTALAEAHAEAQHAVQQAPAKNVDETGWKKAGRKQWLWAAATQWVVCFVILPTRGAASLAALLGKRIRGIVSSDRFSAYGRLKLGRRQVCWAHLKRDFQKLVDRGGDVATDVGEMGLDAVEIIFDLWHSFRGGGLSRRQLQHQLGSVRTTLREVLASGCADADASTIAFCENVLAIEPALWTFLHHEGIEPTNNHIERLLRPGVLWRKNAFGCHSDAGCRFVERILTVVHTLRLQKRPVLDFLYQSLLAYRLVQPAPLLLDKA
jgi:transposase